MSEQDQGPTQHFDESEYMLRHKTEAHNMFDLLDSVLGRRLTFDYALDIGGGFGDHLPFLMDRIGKVVSADIIDYMTDNRFSPREMAARASRYGGHLDLSTVSFHHCDAESLIYRDDLFDYVFSINAFEHIPNPLLALSEVLRVTRKGAPVYIQFDPIWNSPWGHHLPHLGFEPWAHLLNSEEEFCDLILALGGTQVDISIFKTAMNRQSLAYYKTIFLQGFWKRFVTTSFATWSTDVTEEPASRHPNFDRCRSKGYEVEELITRGVQFVGVKAW